MYNVNLRFGPFENPLFPLNPHAASASVRIFLFTSSAMTPSSVAVPGTSRTCLSLVVSGSGQQLLSGSFSPHLLLFSSSLTRNDATRLEISARHSAKLSPSRARPASSKGAANLLNPTAGSPHLLCPRRRWCVKGSRRNCGAKRDVFMMEFPGGGCGDNGDMVCT
ncbi:hypothetical protein NL676_007570 [Syzygium grande]|nr:hypothetical protein NL676_007570 [Syzygium grande]